MIVEHRQLRSADNVLEFREIGGNPTQPFQPVECGTAPRALV
jgi:hypothetical protein